MYTYSILNQTGDNPPPGDPFTVLLLNANQTAGTNIAIDDTGLRTITNSANNGTSAAAPPLTGAPPKFGANALQKSADAFDLSSTSAFSQTETELNTDMDISGSDDFCVEFWVRFTAEVGTPTTRDIFNLKNSVDPAWCAVRSNNRTLTLYVDGTEVGDSPQIPLNTWAHVVLNRRRSTIYNLYVDGVKTGVISKPTPGGDTSYRALFLCSLEDQPIFDAMRMCVGGAVYHDAFDVPTSEPGIINSDPEIGGRVVALVNMENGVPGSQPATDDIGNPMLYNATTGGFLSPGSGPKVDASGRFGQCFIMEQPFSTEFPSYINSAAWIDPGRYAFNNNATTNMCVEAWVKFPGNLDGTQYIAIGFSSFSGDQNGSPYTFGSMIFNSGGAKVRLLRADMTNSQFDIAGTDLTAWNHFAAVLEDGVGKMYVNGAFVGDWGAPFTNTTTGVCKPAMRAVDQDDPNVGFVDGYRYTLGSPVYTGPFTPPAGPPTTSIP